MNNVSTSSIESSPRLAVGDFVLHTASSAIGIIEKLSGEVNQIARVHIPKWGVYHFPAMHIRKIEAEKGIMIRTERTICGDGCEITRLIRAIVPKASLIPGLVPIDIHPTIRTI